MNYRFTIVGRGDSHFYAVAVGKHRICLLRCGRESSGLVLGAPGLEVVLVEGPAALLRAREVRRVPAAGLDAAQRASDVLAGGARLGGRALDGLVQAEQAGPDESDGRQPAHAILVEPNLRE